MARTAKKTAASQATKDDPMAGANPLVGVRGIAEQVSGPATAEEQRRAIETEYGQYVATQAITHDGALAYNVGDAVPAANVEQWGYLDLGLVAQREGASPQDDDEPVDDPA